MIVHRTVGLAVRRRGLTLAELLAATVVGVLLASATGVVIGHQLRAESRSASQRTARERAHLAADSIARDVLAAARHHDLRFALLRVHDGMLGDTPRDELLVLTRSSRRLRDADVAPEGGEYEVQYRVAPGPDGADTLWRRVDHAFDPVPEGGGVAVPMIAGVTGLELEASNGVDWFDQWDSDALGLPHAVRITVRAQDDAGHVTAVARRVVAVDRVPVPDQTASGGGSAS